MKLRVEKLQELIKQEVGKMLLKEIKDPRIGFVTVTDVEMTGDLREAKIFVSLMGNEEQVKNSWAGLQSALGFIRREIGHRIRLRFTPFVSFAIDKSLDYGEHIQKLLLQIEREKQSTASANDNPAVEMRVAQSDGGNSIGAAVVMILLMMFTLLAPVRSEAAEKELVLLDSDMVDMFDDGVAMMMLAKAPNIELLGVTTVTGNDWVQNGTASAIRQLEGIGVKDIPVVEGITPKYIKKRLANLNNEIEQFGYGFDQHVGAASKTEPSDWRAAYRNNYKTNPTLEPMNASAVDFIILMARAHPDELTIVEIGPCTNLAAAIKKAPDIVPLIKRVVYMGGAFFQQGNVMPAAEFNVWFDPTAAKECIRAEFKEQIFLPLDACEKVVLNTSEFKRMTREVKSPIIAALHDRILSTAGNDRSFVWDILAAAVVIDPTLIVDEEKMPVDVNDVYSPSYGQTLAYRRAPRGTQTARIVTAVDQFKLRSMLDRLFKSI
mgnify:CR=1 FL=1